MDPTPLLVSHEQGVPVNSHTCTFVIASHTETLSLLNLGHQLMMVHPEQEAHQQITLAIPMKHTPKDPLVMYGCSGQHHSSGFQLAEPVCRVYQERSPSLLSALTRLHKWIHVCERFISLFTNSPELQRRKPRVWVSYAFVHT